MAKRLEVTVVEMGPRQVGRDPRNLKIRKGDVSVGLREFVWGTVRWSRLLKNYNKRRARVAQARMERRPRREVASGFNATIVVATISCRIARNGKKLKTSFAPPREKISLAPFAHTDGSLGWNPWITRKQRGRR